MLKTKYIFCKEKRVFSIALPYKRFKTFEILLQFTLEVTLSVEVAEDTHPGLFHTKDFKNIQGGSKKVFDVILEEKCLRDYKIFFDGVFLSIYSYLLKK